MKRLLSTIAIILIISGANAQDTHDIICLRTGCNLARHIDDAKTSSKIKFGINAGLTVDFEIFNNFFARPGIMFSMKGARYDNYDQVENLNYFELPLLVAYKINITNNIVADFQTGPFLAGGAFGMVKRHEPNYFEYRAFKRYNNDEYRRFDVGLNFGVGVILKKHYYFGFGYDLSFRLLHEPDYMTWHQRNGCSMINIGYYL